MRADVLGKYVLAVDIGTTSTKTLIVDDAGVIHGQYAVNYPLHTPMPDRAEQDPEVIFHAAITGVREVLRSAGVDAAAIACLSFSCAMHSLLAVDEHFNPLTQSITWADNRAVMQADRLKNSTEGQGIYLRTGTPIHPMSPLAKLIWLRESAPEIFAKAAWFMGIKTYILAKLFGRIVMDHSLASATGLLNLNALAWDEEALNMAGITADRLPELVPTTYRLQGLSESTAQQMGLSINTPFIIGASDGTLANLGVGAVDPGVFAVSIGTSGAVRAMVPKPLADPRGRLFCYALTEQAWVVGGAVNSGGIVLRWVRDVLATQEANEARHRGIEPYAYLIDLAAEAPAGSGGLLMLPMLTGERAPHWDANVRGVYFGLSLAHGKPHMIRAALEGVVFGLYSVAASLNELLGQGTQIRASGGFARSVFWRQIMTDVWGMPLVVPEMIESSALGAAYLGWMAIGAKNDFAGIHQWVKLGPPHVVNPSDQQVYQPLFRLYEQVYNQLIPSFHTISHFQNKRA